MTLDEALCEVVNSWYSNWHRGAEEDEAPPEYMQVVIDHLIAAGLKKNLYVEERLLE